MILDYWNVLQKAQITSNSCVIHCWNFFLDAASIFLLIFLNWNSYEGGMNPQNNEIHNLGILVIYHFDVVFITIYIIYFKGKNDNSLQVWAMMIHVNLFIVISFVHHFDSNLHCPPSFLVHANWFHFEFNLFSSF